MIQYFLDQQKLEKLLNDSIPIFSKKITQLLKLFEHTEEWVIHFFETLKGEQIKKNL